ncbi:hypothetical protein LCGC14_0170430 [marine sediment metagenome]|jgi:hypothetical protein|uniref:Uncharacterized protein n=1 Tax=marine sediment metagenome TaxID=412755 RepID=A0A0F9UWH3_9ZZZZ
MSEEQLITKVSQILTRPDGSECKIVAERFFGPSFQEYTGIYVLRRESPEHNWTLLNDRPAPGWREMSVDEYVQHGRSEQLRAVSPGEIMRAASLLGQPMSILQ